MVEDPDAPIADRVAEEKGMVPLALDALELAFKLREAGSVARRTRSASAGGAALNPVSGMVSARSWKIVWGTNPSRE